MMWARVSLLRSSRKRRSSARRASRSLSSSRESFSMRSDWLLTSCSSPAVVVVPCALPPDEVAVPTAAAAAEEIAEAVLARWDAENAGAGAEGARREADCAAPVRGRLLVGGSGMPVVSAGGRRLNALAWGGGRPETAWACAGARALAEAEGAGSSESGVSVNESLETKGRALCVPKGFFFLAVVGGLQNDGSGVYLSHLK